MAEKTIIQNMISQLGQSQGDRISKALAVDFAKVDERTPEDLLLFARQFAPFVNYYRGNLDQPEGVWTNFFSAEAATTMAGTTLPHMALFLAFLELYKQPQEILNRLTGRHLDFYYHDVLRLEKKKAVPDKAHVLVQLKKQSSPTSVNPTNIFTAGKDNNGVELIYAPTRQTIINTATVDSLRSIFVDSTGHGIVRYAPIANSSDGVGGALPTSEPKWAAFGNEELPPAEVGFAIASSVLRMKEGTRKITLKLTLNNYAGLASSVRNAFKAYVTAEKNWAELDISSATLSSGGVLQLELVVRDGEKAIIDYDPAVHGYSYTAVAPVVQLLLDASVTTIGYRDFKNVTLQKAVVSVQVSNITLLNLENDEGTLDPKKAFLPFGAQPTTGSRFIIGYDEALAKKLSQVVVQVKWKDAPSNFATRYANYGVTVYNSSFTAGVAFRDGGSWNNANTGVGLFDSGDATNEHTFTFTPGSFSVSSSPSPGQHLYALSQSGSHWTIAAANSFVLRQPVLGSFRTQPPQARSGFITFALERDFLHATYRTEYARHVMKYSKDQESPLVILNEPYTPAIQGVSLSYTAHSDDVSVASADLADFSNPDLQFFHIAYFGQMREHGYQREQFSFLVDKRVPLLPAYSNEGELLIGVSNLNPEDSISLLFQVAEGSDDPDLEPADISWAVLCDNYWKPLGSESVVGDTTNQLLRSGIIVCVIPAEATTQNTILPPGRIWLKAGIKKDVAAVCRLTDVAANVIEVQFTDQGNDPAHLLTPLEPGKIAKLKNGLAAVQAVKQPYASFDGASEEADENFYNRVAERLRHKDRCITPWDYERVVLEAFPAVHKVKCIPHAKEGSWLAPGSVLLVVIPDLQNRNATDILEPKVNANTLDQITDWVQARAGMQVQVKVKNPSYERIRADFKVKFRTGYEFNYYSEELKKELIAFLSPWAFQPDRDIVFGGKIYKSVLLDFVERRDSVDYVTDFRMYSYLGRRRLKDVSEAQASTPDAILVSDYTHIVKPV